MGSDTGRQSADEIPPVDATGRGRFDAVETNDGDLIVYDVEIEEAWIQSDWYCSSVDWA